MDEYDYIDTESEPEHPFAVLRLFIRVFCGPLFWPVILVNVIA